MKKKPENLWLLRQACTLLFSLFLIAGPIDRLKAQTPDIPAPITIKAESISVSDLIAAIEKQCSYVFSYDKIKLSTLYVRNIQWDKMPLGKALAELQTKAHLQYTFLDNNIAVTVSAPSPVQKTTAPPAKTSLRGRVVDFETSQPLAGATVTIQETGWSVQSDEKGYYSFSRLATGSYTITASYAGYQKNYLPAVRVDSGGQQFLDIKMQTGTSLGEAVVIAGPRKVKAVTHATDKDLLREIHDATGVVSGISNESISRTADRNAAEVMKRVSGVTVVDNRFVVVRGMNERYNVTYLNDNIAPSTELYTRAFAYDLLPSSIIDRILVFKSPRADLSGMFAGAAIKVYTKNAMPVRHFDIGVQVADRPGSTMTTVNGYNGGRLDWLGFDDGTRKLPSWSPGVFQTTRSVPATVSQTQIVQGLSPVLTYGQLQSTPDLQVYANYYNAWRFGKRARLYDLTSITYTKETTNYNQHRQTGNTFATGADFNSAGGLLFVNDHLGTYQQTTGIGKVNVLENLALTLGRHNTLQFKNFFVNDGRVFTGINDYRVNQPPVDDTATGLVRYKDIILSFQQRTLYSGNLGGVHEWGGKVPQGLEWNLGYTHDLQNVPDQRISHFQTLYSYSSAYEPPGLNYVASGTNIGDYDNGFQGMISRLFIKNKEDIYNFSADYTLHAGRVFQVKTGTFQLFKDRQVGRRFFRVNRGGLGPDEVIDLTTGGASPRMAGSRIMASATGASSIFDPRIWQRFGIPPILPGTAAGCGSMTQPIRLTAIRPPSKTMPGM